MIIDNKLSVLTVSSVMMECTCVQNIIHVKRENKKPSNTPIIIKIKTNGAGSNASQPSMI